MLFLKDGRLTVGLTKGWIDTKTNGQKELSLAGHTHSYAAASHTHMKAEITDFPTTMTPSAHVHAASDVTSGTLSADRIPGLAASKITSGTLGVARGGTGVTANPLLLVNLASTSAASVFAASPRPGVTGVLPIANGGTGATSLESLGTIISPYVTPVQQSVKEIIVADWENDSSTDNGGNGTLIASVLFDIGVTTVNVSIISMSTMAIANTDSSSRKDTGSVISKTGNFTVNANTTTLLQYSRYNSKYAADINLVITSAGAYVYALWRGDVYDSNSNVYVWLDDLQMTFIGKG